MRDGALTPIINDIDLGTVVTRVVMPLHRDSLEVGAEPAPHHMAVSLFASCINPGHEA